MVAAVVLVKHPHRVIHDRMAQHFITVNLSITYCIEIFDIGGKTLPNRHQYAIETFLMLKGEGIVLYSSPSIITKATPKDEVVYSKR